MIDDNVIQITDKDIIETLTSFIEYQYLRETTIIEYGQYSPEWYNRFKNNTVDRITTNEQFAKKILIIQSQLTDYEWHMFDIFDYRSWLLFDIKEVFEISGIVKRWQETVYLMSSENNKNRLLSAVEQINKVSLQDRLDATPDDANLPEWWESEK